MSFLCPHAYVYAHGDTLHIQLVSLAARSIPGLTPDKDGLLIVPMDEAETVFALLDGAGGGLPDDGLKERRKKP